LVRNIFGTIGYVLGLLSAYLRISGPPVDGGIPQDPALTVLHCIYDKLKKEEYDNYIASAMIFMEKKIVREGKYMLLSRWQAKKLITQHFYSRNDLWNVHSMVARSNIPFYDYADTLGALVLVVGPALPNELQSFLPMD